MGLLKNWENRYSGWQCRLTIIYCAARGGDSGNVFVTALRWSRSNKLKQQNLQEQTTRTTLPYQVCKDYIPCFFFFFFFFVSRSRFSEGYWSGYLADFHFFFKLNYQDDNSDWNVAKKPQQCSNILLKSLKSTKEAAHSQLLLPVTSLARMLAVLSCRFWWHYWPRGNIVPCHSIVQHAFATEIRFWDFDLHSIVPSLFWFSHLCLALETS